MARIEALLAERTVEVDGVPVAHDMRPDHLIWLCVCATESERAPTWTIWDHPDGRLRWSRTDGATPEREARAIAGDHVSPGSVLAWVEGRNDSPWGDDPSGDAVALSTITGLLRRAGDL